MHKNYTWLLIDNFITLSIFAAGINIVHFVVFERKYHYLKKIMSDFVLEECFFNYLSENLVTVCDAFFSAIISPINLKAANIH